MSPSFFDRLRDEGNAAALSGLFQITDNLHSPEVAANIGLAACTEALKAGEAPCVVAAHIRPKRWKMRPLSLSAWATASFKAYRKAEGPKAFAISAGTKAFEMTTDETIEAAQAEAIEKCNEKASGTGSPDCEIVISD